MGRLVRNRAVTLVAAFFARDDQRGRLTVFALAFDGITPDPRAGLDFAGSSQDFAAAAVDHLLAYGGVGRGRHCLLRVAAVGFDSFLGGHEGGFLSGYGVG